MARPVRSLLTAAARVLAMAAAIVVITALTTGWLYWLQGSVATWPGPMVRDALPLDELSGHDRVPLIVCIVAFGLAGTLLGLVARALGFSQLTAGVSLAVGVGGWLFVMDAVSLYIARQQQPSVDFRGRSGSAGGVPRRGASRHRWRAARPARAT
jgi:hypothetical protein